MDLRYKQLVQCSAEGCVTSHQTHANARKHTQTHANTPQTHANTRKRTQTHANTDRKHMQTQSNCQNRYSGSTNHRKETPKKKKLFINFTHRAYH